jgi:hypothetical protein
VVGGVVVVSIAGASGVTAVDVGVDVDAVVARELRTVRAGSTDACGALECVSKPIAVTPTMAIASAPAPIHHRELRFGAGGARPTCDAASVSATIVEPGFVLLAGAVVRTVVTGGGTSTPPNVRSNAARADGDANGNNAAPIARIDG